MKTTTAIEASKTPMDFPQALHTLQEGHDKYIEFLTSGRWDRLKTPTLETFISQYHLPIASSKENLPNNCAASKANLRSEIERVFVRLPALKKEYEALCQLHEVTNTKNVTLNALLHANQPQAAGPSPNSSGMLHKRAKKFIEKYSNMSTAFSNPTFALFPTQQSLHQSQITALTIATSNLSIEAPSPSTLDTPTATPLERSASSSASSLALFTPPIRHHGLHVVLDLDETLIRYTETPGEVINFHGYIKYQEGNAHILMRSYAVEFIINLLAMDCRIYILTAGTQSYCDSVWGFLKSHLLQSVSSEILDNVVAKSCRDSLNNVVPKDFYMVGIPAAEVHQAIAVDNNRMAWDRHAQDQIVVIPDWTPETMGEEDQFTFGQVKQRIEQVLNTMKPALMSSPAASPSILTTMSTTTHFPLPSSSVNNHHLPHHAGQILKALYEEEEKQRMKFNARSAMRNRAPPNAM